MMSDLRSQLRDYFEGIAPPVDIDEARIGEPTIAGSPGNQSRKPLIAIGAFIGVFALGAVMFALAGSTPPPEGSASTTNQTASSTTPPSTVTTTPPAGPDLVGLLATSPLDGALSMWGFPPGAAVFEVEHYRHLEDMSRNASVVIVGQVVGPGPSRRIVGDSPDDALVYQSVEVEVIERLADDPAVVRGDRLTVEQLGLTDQGVGSVAVFFLRDKQHDSQGRPSPSARPDEVGVYRPVSHQGVFVDRGDGTPVGPMIEATRLSDSHLEMSLDEFIWTGPEPDPTGYPLAAQTRNLLMSDFLMIVRLSSDPDGLESLQLFIDEHPEAFVGSYIGDLGVIVVVLGPDTDEDLWIPRAESAAGGRVALDWDRCDVTREYLSGIGDEIARRDWRPGVADIAFALRFDVRSCRLEVMSEAITDEDVAILTDRYKERISFDRSRTPTRLPGG